MAGVTDGGARASSVELVRTAEVPDEVRIERCRRLPEFGPRILFFSGGSALRGLSRRLKLYTENSIHLITPFDSGGSSALLRQAFGMPSVGDLRNRLIALADESARGSPEIYRLFSHRFSSDGDPEALSAELAAMVVGEHRLVRDIPKPLRQLIRTHLRQFSEKAPETFDYRLASIGNLILAGGYLHNDRDLDSVVYLFSRLVQVKGTVALTSDADRHMVARLTDGCELAGQHRITGRSVPPISSPIEDVYLVDSLETRRPSVAEVSRNAARLIHRADLVCYPMGSFYSSIVANLLPTGVGRAIAEASCPKVYIPNTGNDPEQLGMSPRSAVEAIRRTVRRDAGDVPAHRILNLAIADVSDDVYESSSPFDELRSLGVTVLRTPLVTEQSHPRLDPQRLTEALLSIA
jgi:CofD-related protein of GAK system